MIKHLRMKNFRRFKDEKITFKNNLSYIEGQNNAGKTSIFLAIEYGLFGTVSGFRSQSSLFHPGTKKMGVELYYKGKSEKIFKLQRMHEKKGRGATGHYTLKLVHDDESETYLISSDFENNSEEMLQLKIFETLGISKRLFDVAINIRQGEIPAILDGNKYLDIVLGVSAASIAQKQLNSVALGFEKETSQYETLKNSLEAYISERKELKKQETNLQKEMNNLTKEKDEFDNELNQAKQFSEKLNPVSERFQHYHQYCLNWDRAHEKLHEHLLRKQKIENDAGDIVKINEFRINLNTTLKKLENEISELEKSRLKRTSDLRSLEQKKGDLSGKITRRQNLSQGEEATCEECGAVIDQERVKTELNQWKIEKENIESQIKENEKHIDNIQTQEKEKQLNIREISSQITKNSGFLEQLKTLDDEGNELSSNLDDANEHLLDSAVELYEQLQLYNEEKEEENKVNIPRPELIEIDSLIEISKEVIMARSMNAMYTQKLDNEKEKLRKTVEDAKVEFRVISDKLKDRENQQNNLKPRIEQINKQMAEINSNLKQLEKKRIAAEKMRLSAKIFRNLQTILRERAAISLAQKTLTYHNELSENIEYSDLTVDPKNYTIYVKPTDIGEEVPVSTYQGGGHKLLLGIAFKLAVINFVTKPPFILLDEPTYGLDALHKTKLFDKIDEITNSQLLLITHQRDARPVEGSLLQVVKDGSYSRVEEVS